MHSNNEGFNLEFSFQQQTINQQRYSEYRPLQRFLPEAKKLLEKKYPKTDEARVIRNYGLYKMPQKFEKTEDIEKPYFEDQRKKQQISNYRRYPFEQTLQQRYSNRQKLIYSKYRENVHSPYTHTSFSGKYINVFQLLHLQEQDCEQLVQKDYSRRQIFDQIYSQQILFESRFESGNLLKVYESGKAEYDLILENDTNTSGYNQWFYFMVANVPKGQRIKINIVNMINNNRFYNQGMRPAIMSVKRYKNIGRTWYRGGYNIQYTKNNLKRSKQSNKYFYSLSFSFDFEYFEDVVYFAYSFPYSYSKLLRKITDWQNDLKILMKKSILCLTPSQNLCYLLTLSVSQKMQKPLIVICARQHPGETVSNFVLQGILQYLIANKQILERFDFKIIPMLNIDGCIYGNFRTNLVGVDVNRKWNEADKFFNPEIYYLKSLIEQVQKSTRIEYFIDLHGHSKQFGTFIYCCGKSKNNKILPFYLGEINETFCRKNCTFGIDASKEQTARATVYRMNEKIQSITIQTSFYGFKKMSEVFDYYPKQLLKMGNDIARAIDNFDKVSLDYKFQNPDDSGSDEDPTKDYIEQIQTKVKKLCDQYKTQIKKQRKIIQSREKTKSQMKIRRKVGSCISKTLELQKSKSSRITVKNKIHPASFLTSSDFSSKQVIRLPKTKILGNTVSSYKPKILKKLKEKSVLQINLRLSALRQPKKYKD